MLSLLYLLSALSFMPLKKNIRKSVRDRAILLANKKSLTKPFRLKQKIKGTILYRNPKAIPVSNIIEERGKRKPFTMENVEWISIHRDKEGFLGKGGFGAVYIGKVKFKGVSKAQDVAIKKYFERNNLPSKGHLEDLISRIQSSGVPAPKMGVLEVPTSTGRLQKYLITELFASKKAEQKSKLRYAGWSILESPNILSTDFERDCFNQIIDLTARLAVKGVSLSEVYHDSPFQNDLYPEQGSSKIDEFTIMLLKNGKPKVVLHDIDFMEISNSPKTAWKSSHEKISALLSRGLDPRQFGEAKQLMLTYAKKYGLI